MRRFRDEDASVEKILHYWPLIVVLFAGVGAYFKLSNTVDNLQAQADQRQKNLDTQREKRSEEMELVRTRLTRLEDAVSILRK